MCDPETSRMRRP